MTTDTGHATPSSLNVLDLPAAAEAGGAYPTRPHTYTPPATENSPGTGSGPAAEVVRPITPPPPVPSPAEQHVPFSTTPPGPLCDLPYRFLARVALLGVPDQSGDRPTVLTLAEPLVPTGTMPLPLLIREPGNGNGRLIQVGTVTVVYRTGNGTEGDEVCASGEFDLTRPFVPGLVAELARAAGYGSPMTVIPQLADLEYAPDLDPEGPRVMTAWKVTGLILGQIITWPGCHLLPDDGHVRVEVAGVPYPMRRHHDRNAWRSLVRAYRAQSAPGAGEWEALAGTLFMLAACTTTAVHNDLARRLLTSGDALTLAGLMLAMPDILDQLDADDRRRGGVL